MPTHVRWTDEEQIQLSHFLFEARKSDPLTSISGLLEQVQLNIPERRRRKFTNLKAADGVIRRFHAIWQSCIQAQVAKAVEPSAPELKIVEIEKQVERDLVQVPTVELKTELWRREENDRVQLQAMCQLLEQLAHVVTHRVVTCHAPAATPPAVRVTRRMRIGIVGLLHDQFNHVVEKFNCDGAELIFIDKEKMNIPRVDKVIVQKHSSHVAWDQVRQAVGTDNVIFVDGGITAVTQTCFDLYSRKVTYYA